MKLFNLVILFLFLISLGAGSSFCQLNSNYLNSNKEKRINTRIKKLKEIQKFQSQKHSISEFRNIEKAIAQGDISQLTKYFNSRTYLNLKNSVSGYYSNNQVYYVLKRYFRKHKVKTFKFSEIYTDANTPYAIGSYYFNTRNGRRSLRVYVSLIRIKNEWKILQITLN
ncbi:MAG: DUF4783 domain-containing protein [Bacteroidetes bacterium]|nr:DUF4783 domain-containing protein [Bacteroidota bacterium]